MSRRLGKRNGKRAQGRIGPALLALLLVSGGCGWMPAVYVESPFGRSGYIELKDAAVLTEPSPRIAVTIVNQKGSSLSVSIEIDEVEGSDDCRNTVRLRANESHRYVCPQRAVFAGKRFNAEIVVYRDLGEYQQDVKWKRYINRWHLEKRDPKLALSPPKERAWDPPSGASTG